MNEKAELLFQGKLILWVIIADLLHIVSAILINLPLRKFFLLILLISMSSIGSVPSLAHGTDTLSVHESSKIRAPSLERLSEISNDERYFYNEIKMEMSLWDRFMLWLTNLLGEWISSDFMSLFLKISASIAFALILILLINQIMKGELKSAIKGKGNRTILNSNFTSENIETTNYEELIQQALQKRNYGLAVRYLYQKCLIILKEKDLIEWKSDKTNYDYLYELGNHPIASHFDRLTYFYEYIDYGDFKINEQQFNSIHSIYQQFKDQIAKQS